MSYLGLAHSLEVL